MSFKLSWSIIAVCSLYLKTEKTSLFLIMSNASVWYSGRRVACVPSVSAVDGWVTC